MTRFPFFLAITPIFLILLLWKNYLKDGCMKSFFYVAFTNYADLLLLAKTSSKKVPAKGEEVELDFDNPDTEFIEGLWGKESAKGSFSFTVTENSIMAKDFNGLPIIESQFAYDFP